MSSGTTASPCTPRLEPRSLADRLEWVITFRKAWAFLLFGRIIPCFFRRDKCVLSGCLVCPGHVVHRDPDPHRLRADRIQVAAELATHRISTSGVNSLHGGVKPLARWLKWRAGEVAISSFISRSGANRAALSMPTGVSLSCACEFSTRPAGSTVIVHATGWALPRLTFK